MLANPLVRAFLILWLSSQGMRATAQTDTAHLNQLLDKARFFRDENPDSGRILLRQFFAQNPPNQNPEQLSGGYNVLGIYAEDDGNLDSALLLYRKGLALRRTLHKTDLIVGSLGNIGAVWETLGQMDSAFSVYTEMLHLANESGNELLISKAHYILGMALESEGAYTEAHENANTARYFAEKNHYADLLPKVYTLLGHVRFETELYKMAIDWYQKALDLQRLAKDKRKIAESLSDLANAYDESKSHDIAEQYYLEAEKLYVELQDDDGLSNVYNNLGDVYKHEEKYDRALWYLQKSEKLRRVAAEPSELIEVENSLGDVYYAKKEFKKALEKTKDYYERALAIGDKKYIQKGLKDFAKNYAALGQYQRAYDFRTRYDEYRYERLDEVRARDFERREVLFGDRQKQDELDRRKSELQLRDTQLARSRATAFGFLGGACALLLLAGWLINRNRLKQRANLLLEAKNAAIAAEKQRADDLLHNILPAETALELKQSNKVKPVRYDSVTVVFTDFKNFTTIAEQMTPEALVDELDDYFQLFDQITAKYRLEKIKTIGDAYMCAGGLPSINHTHALDAVEAALEMQRQMTLRNAQKKADNLPYFEMRVGIHTGPVVAGVVGSRKFAYDIWGDTVNTAARMEQNSEPGKINISDTTYQSVKDHFLCSFRGKIVAKNKGEIDMYFVEKAAPSTL